MTCILCAFLPLELAGSNGFLFDATGVLDLVLGHKICLEGTKMSFSQFGLSDSLLRAIEAAGYSQPTPIQAQAIPHLLAAKDVLGCAQTGTGKTAAFALPILQRYSVEANRQALRGSLRCLVLAPTRELALQISESFRQYGRNAQARVVVIYGGVNQERQVQALRRGAEIVVATPGRLRDLFSQRLIRLNEIDTLVLDEADRMLDMGFLPDVKFIINQIPTQRQTILFSATMPTAIESLADSILSEPVRVHVATKTTTAERVSQSVCFVPKANKTKLLADILNRPEVSSAIVFSRTKHGADRIVRQLQRYEITAEALHGNKSQNARQRILTAFRAQQVRVLVATDIAARGIDVDGISHVFNYDLPMEAETYIHRIGRTARAGAEGTAISFCGPDERSLLRDIERLLQTKIPVDQQGLGPMEAGHESRDGDHFRREHRPQGNGMQQPNSRRRTLSGKIRTQKLDTRPRYGSSGRGRRRKPAAAR